MQGRREVALRFPVGLASYRGYSRVRWERCSIQSEWGRRLRRADLARRWRRNARSAWASDAERGSPGDGGVTARLADLASLERSARGRRGVSGRARTKPTSAAWTLARSGSRKSPKAVAVVTRNGEPESLLFCWMRVWRSARACSTRSRVKRGGLAPETVSPAGVVRN